MVIIEPPLSFAERQATRFHEIQELLAAPLTDKTGWDEAILNHLRMESQQPILIMHVVNGVVKHLRHTSTRHRDAMRVEIIRAVGSLIRRKRILRVKRRFVAQCR